MGLDGSGGYEQFRGNLGIAESGGRELGDASFHGGQARAGRRPPEAQAFNFCARPVLPERGAEPRKDRQRSLKMGIGRRLVPESPMDLPGDQEGPTVLEWHAQSGMELEGKVKCALRGVAVARHRP